MMPLLNAERIRLCRQAFLIFGAIVAKRAAGGRLSSQPRRDPPQPSQTAWQEPLQRSAVAFVGVILRQGRTFSNLGDACLFDHAMTSFHTARRATTGIRDYGQMRLYHGTNSRRYT